MVLNLIIFLAAFLVGFLLYRLAIWSQEIQLIASAKRQAADMISDAKESTESFLQDIQASHEEQLDGLKNTLELESAPVLEKIQDEISELEAKIQAVKASEKEELQELNDQLSRIGDRSHNLEQRAQKATKELEGIRSRTEQYAEKLEQAFSLDGNGLMESQIRRQMDELVRETQTRATEYLKWVQDEAQEEAKKLISRALDRFHRPHCPERNIGNVVLTNERVRQELLTDSIRSVIENQCGVDLGVPTDPVSADQGANVMISGFDPVRREMARRLLEVFAKTTKPVQVDWLEKKAQAIKNEVFRDIQVDGDRLAKELRLNNLAPEIKRMMGCLRYRYSFSQNQYFHCIEVGWLCGLLATELGTDWLEARRSGTLHDIGKSMDHSMDGGHAMIGANFIQTHGESEQVVHNVRAHHYDEAPSTPNAFLVIGADALSGGRPGARRSTVESYNQKVSELERIGGSFKGVLATYVVSGGRELRVLVEDRHYTDSGTVKLAKEISKQIEENCVYPGQIRVTVIKEKIQQATTFANLPAS